MLIFSVYNSLPPTFRYQLKKLFRTAGHSQSWFDGLIARRDARGKKSLARSLQHTLHLLDKAGIESLQGLRTLDFGAGYVPTDTVSHWLMGAAHASALDYNAIADFGALRQALLSDDEAALLKLVPAAQQGQFAERLRALRTLAPFTRQSLETLGISYLAPFDVLRDKPAQPFDLIMSTSVLEHIAPANIAALLRSLAAMLSPHGRMVHEIHLEDHLDIRNDPWNFVRTGTTYNPATDHDARGNRVLRKQWASFFAGLGSCRSSETEIRFTDIGKVPAKPQLLPEYRQLPLKELRVSHLVYVSQCAG